ncbi:trypsin-like peptidase [Mangrovibacterium marinum]|uniref:Trypsin-like peptidase n=1 Tax=Mangrovibacterium marinum TaxID=1639118 RepID=A0A2T5BXQ0_9BACT|nr:serine protease [Mangrovibacterium marinum]PTN05924.1 trypsin-like peptidase [Mangrovibacterium marinum]
MKRITKLKLLAVYLLFCGLVTRGGEAAAQSYPNQWTDWEKPLIEQADSIIKAGTSVSQEEAREQAAPNVGPVKLSLHQKKNEKRLSTPDLYRKVAAATVIMTDACLCDNCDQLHIFPATGYLISPEGVCVTNYHVLNYFMNRDGHFKPQAFVACMHDGRTLAVRKVLLAAPEYDLAILQLDTSNEKLPFLSLAEEAEIGDDAFIVSHPQGMYYTLSQGIVTGKQNIGFPTFDGKSTIGRDVMTISADFATGSSGAAIVNTAGNVIGTVSATRTLFHTGLPDKPVQMVVKTAIPVASLKKLIQ